MKPTCGSRPDALALLIKVNVVQMWRRVSSVRRDSWLPTLAIALFLIGYVAVAFVLFYKGLVFTASFPGLGDVLVERMLFLLFAFLFVLLLLSNIIISYTSLFRNRETIFLLSLPIPPQTIFQWKFIESTVLASWAFLFLIAPLLVAYGMTQDVPWHFYVGTALIVLLATVLPASIGVWCALFLARFLDRRSFKILLIALAALLIAAGAAWFEPVRITDEQLETRVLVVLDRILGKTRFAMFPLLPSYWVGNSIQQWAEGALREAAFYMLVMLSNALLFGSIAFMMTGPAFYNAASIVQSRGSKSTPASWYRKLWIRHRASKWNRGFLERFLAAIPFLSPDRRALMAKDIRLFWRDTTQWGQTVVLFGLLTVYILNVRHFGSQLTNPFWSTVVSYLNLFACVLTLATVTTRFVYPQFSLEGKRVWIVGMAPLGLPRVMITKLALTTAVSLCITVGLMLCTAWMLQLETERTIDLSIAAVVMAITLNFLATGLGALYPNFKEDNPGRIVSGFGGTFCLVASFFYIVTSVVILVVSSPRGDRTNVYWTVGGRALFLILSCVAGLVPLRSALRNLARFEF